MKPRKPQATRNSGVALVVTLIILVLLAALAVGLLQTAGLEQGTSKAVADKAKADLIAQTAINAAIAQLVDKITKYPDSATTWETINRNDGAVLYYRDETPEQAINSGTPAQLYVFPLMSGATAQTFLTKNNSIPVLTDTGSTPNAYNFNHTRFSGDTQGWIGTAPGAATVPQPLRGEWINATDSDSKITGRYAYWMEDESFKANANYMGNTARGSNTMGDNPNQIPFQGILKTVLTGNPDYDGIAASITSYRGNFPSAFFFNYSDINQVSGQSTLADNAKFEATIFSGTSNLSRSGTKRVNLNKVVSDSTVPTAIRNQLDQIITSITYHLPNFPQRFYRNATYPLSNPPIQLNSLDVSSSGAPSNQTIYLNKVAANIHDYIDTDSQPTIVNNDLTVNIGIAPMHSLPGGGASGPNEVIAIGKEAVPQIQEYMVREKQIEPQFKASITVISQNYHIEIDHYVEFWNMTDRDITVANLGPNPFLRIANQFGWTSYGGTDIPVDPSRDFSIPLNSFRNSSGSSLVFAAGTATVLTTDPVSLPSTLQNVDPSRIFTSTPADSYRVYQGICKPKSPGTSYPHLDSQPRPGSSTPSNSGDIETEIILGNDNGVLESFGAPEIWYLTVNADDGTQSRQTKYVDQTQYNFRATSLKGNSPSFSPTISQTGDPRTNNEQLSLNSTSAVGDDQTNYKTELNQNQVPSASNNDASFTQLNTTYVNPALWTDPAINTADAAHAPAVIANVALTSIGQLGDIFDPVRLKGVSGDITLSRGGGRTFKTGQPEAYDAILNPGGLWDGSSNSASREWTAWRLADVFTTSDLVQLDGRININGVNRDGGAAFKAALYGYNFQASPDSDPTIASQPLTDAEVSSLISQMQARLNNDATAYNGAFKNTVGPFAERGELSEMPAFNSGTQLTGQNMASIYDRGREELFKRLAELITTRGNIFTVYAVGQALIPQSGSTTPVVTSTSQLKVTFRIDPIWNSGTPSDPFDPTNPSNRFKKPDRYAVKILYAGS